ncbi:MAG: hypothetical protein OXN96_13685 [Bryobacterales bacterium]|nr:hypothetical protein [Bryobacterales bacterium]
MLLPRSSRSVLGVAASLRTAAALALAHSLSAQPGWVAETPHFRVLALEAPGIDAAAAGFAATVLEQIRQQFRLFGAGLPERADGPLEVLVVPNEFELHELLREAPDSRTRGITVGGLDRDYVVIPWHAVPGPQITLAHEYAHQLDRPRWPLWFREGRAVYLARRTASPSGQDTRMPLLTMLEGSEWLDWRALLEAERDSAAVNDQLFQAQSWLLVQWLATRRGPLARLRPDHGSAALSELGQDLLTTSLREHLATMRDGSREELATLPPTDLEADTRAAAEWEVPLVRAEIERELRFHDVAERKLRSIAQSFPGAARAQAAYASMLLIRGELDSAERHFRTAIELGDARSRTSYRYALLLMRPGELPRIRAEAALHAAKRALATSPSEPLNQLAVAHARMLLHDWNGAFAELLKLSRFAGWADRAAKEAAEVVRRKVQSIQSAPPPDLAAEPAPIPDLLARMAVVEGKPDPWKPPSATTSPLPQPYPWAPHGAWIAHGRIAWVDCSNNARTVILHSPYRRYAFRENPERPPVLINRPFRAKAVPCNTRGYVVRISYRRLSEEGGPDGEIFGIHF